MNADLLPCPFCGFQPNPDDADCIYPATRDRTVWSLNCYETGGGCSTHVLGSSPEDCIAKWNRRAASAAPAEAPRGEVVVTWDEYRTRILAVTRQNVEGEILSVIAEAPQGDDVEVGGTCNVCGNGVRYGSRHHRCGEAIMRVERAARERERDAYEHAAKECERVSERHGFGNGHWTDGLKYGLRIAAENIRALLASPDSLDDFVDVRTRYDELLLAVEKKFPGETRHQTALRYIREREAPAGDQRAASTSLLREPVRVSGPFTDEQIRRGAEVLRSLKEPPTRGW